MKNKELNTHKCLPLIKNSLIKFKINLKLQDLSILIINRVIIIQNLINQNSSNPTLSNLNFRLKKIKVISFKKAMKLILNIINKNNHFD